MMAKIVDGIRRLRFHGSSVVILRFFFFCIGYPDIKVDSKRSLKIMTL